MTDTVFGHEVQRVEGVTLCACLDVASDIGQLVLETGKQLPADTFLDAADYDGRWGVSVTYPSGLRLAIWFSPDDPPTAHALAAMFHP